MVRVWPQVLPLSPAAGLADAAVRGPGGADRMSLPSPGTASVLLLTLPGFSTQPDGNKTNEAPGGKVEALSERVLLSFP